MGYDWIIDVLADLENFARKNNLEALAQSLNETANVAQIEIAAVQHVPNVALLGDGGGNRTVSTSIGAGRRD